MTNSTRRILATHIVPPFAVAAVLGAIGAFSAWVQEPLLVPSLGSAIFLQTLTPKEPSARVWNTLVGQLAGAASGFAAIFVFAAEQSPSFMTDHRLLFSRVLAALVAVFLTSVLQQVLKATSAAGGATALVVALGAETATAAGAARLVAGILLVTLLGETARRFILWLEEPA